MPALFPACYVCGNSISAEYALSCPRVGLLFVCHNEILDCIANFWGSIMIRWSCFLERFLSTYLL